MRGQRPRSNRPSVPSMSCPFWTGRSLGGVLRKQRDAESLGVDPHGETFDLVAVDVDGAAGAFAGSACHR
nr:hypothetical protein [Kibdelosporangium sp. MJ126-NF4]